MKKNIHLTKETNSHSAFIRSEKQ